MLKSCKLIGKEFDKVGLALLEESREAFRAAAMAARTTSKGVVGVGKGVVRTMQSGVGSGTNISDQAEQTTRDEERGSPRAADGHEGNAGGFEKFAPVAACFSPLPRPLPLPLHYLLAPLNLTQEMAGR